jgi:hypothetical protein
MDGGVPRLTFQQDMAPDRGLVNDRNVCVVCWINMTVAFLRTFYRSWFTTRDSAQAFLHSLATARDLGVLGCLDSREAEPNQLSNLE